ncbi:MAG: hypothetical protein ACOCVC_05465 [Spirochaeta sp.]
MIAQVRTAIERLGAATESELRAETGFAPWQIAHCIEHLVRRGDVERVERHMLCDRAGRSISGDKIPAGGNSPVGGRASVGRAAVKCRGCPFVGSCAPPSAPPVSAAGSTGSLHPEPAYILAVQ